MNIKIKILRDLEASTNGITSQSYKKGEVIELGTPRLSVHLLEWFQRNEGFGQIITEAIETKPETQIEPELIMEESKEEIMETKEEIMEEKIIESKPKKNKKNTKYINPFNK